MLITHNLLIEVIAEVKSIHGNVDPEDCWNTFGGKRFVYNSDVGGVSQLSIFLKDTKINQIDISTCEPILAESIVNEFGDYSQGFSNYDEVYFFSWIPPFNEFGTMYVETPCSDYSEIKNLTTITLAR